ARANATSIAVTQARAKFNRRPTSPSRVDPPLGLRRTDAMPKASELYVDLRRFRGPRGLRKGAKAPARGRPTETKTQRFQLVANVRTILPICALVSMRACARDA